LPSGLPGGPIVLEGFVGNLLRSEPGSTQEEVRRERINQQMVSLLAGTARIEWTRSVEETHGG
jgi:hypothetical protein